MSHAKPPEVNCDSVLTKLAVAVLVPVVVIKNVWYTLDTI